MDVVLLVLEYVKSGWEYARKPKHFTIKLITKNHPALESFYVNESV